MKKFGSMANAFKKAAENKKEDTDLTEAVDRNIDIQEKAMRQEERKNKSKRERRNRRMAEESNKEQRQNAEHQKEQQERSERVEEYIKNNRHYDALLEIHLGMKHLEIKMDHFRTEDNAEIKNLYQEAMDKLTAARNNMTDETEKALEELPSEVSENVLDRTISQKIGAIYTDAVVNVSTPLEQLKIELQQAHKDVEGYSELIKNIERLQDHLSVDEPTLRGDGYIRPHKW